MLESLFDMFFDVLNALPGFEFFIALMGACCFYGFVGLIKSIFVSE